MFVVYSWWCWGDGAARNEAFKLVLCFGWANRVNGAVCTVICNHEMRPTHSRVETESTESYFHTSNLNQCGIISGHCCTLTPHIQPIQEKKKNWTDSSLYSIECIAAATNLTVVGNTKRQKYKKRKIKTIFGQLNSDVKYLRLRQWTKPRPNPSRMSISPVFV